jgi:hypothetical protein
MFVWFLGVFAGTLRSGFGSVDEAVGRTFRVPYISAIAALPPSIAVGRSLWRIALIIDFTCGMARMARANGGVSTWNLALASALLGRLEDRDI